MKYTAVKAVNYRRILILAGFAAIFFGLALFLDTGWAIRRRGVVGALISFEELIAALGCFFLPGIIFAVLRFSESWCILDIQEDTVTYKNIGLNWPLVTNISFQKNDIANVVTRDGNDDVKINFISSVHRKSGDDKSDDEADLEINAVLFGLTASELMEKLK